MENRNYTSKYMNSIRKEKRIITEQLEILNKTMYFYKNLYSKRHALDIDLNYLLSGYNIPKLNESEKPSLEGPIKYEEILYCRRRLL